MERDATWWPAAQGERQAIRVDSRSTDGAYAVIESASDPDTAVPTHCHRNQEEHFLVLSGHYRIAIGDDIIDAPVGARATVPKNTPHSWRNVSDGESRLLSTIVPGGLEQLAYLVWNTQPEEIPALASKFGCDILGPPKV
jgi:mannose-6-phosphate isomerase-like protein (cupin superfamily)